MDAETAGDASVNDVTESSIPAEATEDKSTENQDGTQLDASSARVAAILIEEGLSDEEVSEVVQPKEKPNAKTSQSEQDRRQEAGDRGAEDGKGAEGEEEEKDKENAERPTPNAQRQTKGKEGGDEEEAVTPEEQKSWPPEALQRIHKKTAQTKAAIARAEQSEAREAALEAKLKSAGQPARAATTEQDPLADVRTPEEFESAVQEYRDLREWAQSNPDGLADVAIGGKNADGTPKTRDYSAKDMAAIVAKTTRILDEHVPKRAQLLHQQSLHEAVAKERLPEMFEDGTEANSFFKAAQRELPAIMNLPGAHNFVRWAFIGRRLDIEEQKAAAEKNGNGKDKATVSKAAAPFLQRHAPQAPGVPTARATTEQARRTAASSDEVTKAQQRVNEGGGEDAEVDLVSALRASQASEKGVPV